MEHLLQAKPNKTYYQMDKSSFAKRGVLNAFSGQSAGKGVFCLGLKRQGGNAKKVKILDKSWE
mgnify:CR=1 FL=1